MRRNLTSQAGLLTGSRALGQIFNALSGIFVVRVLSQFDYGTYRQLILLWSTLILMGDAGFSQSLFQFIPDPSKGILRVQLGSTGAATNPNPALVNIYTNLLVNKQATQEVVLASLMTSPQYITDSTYFRGFYAGWGVRT